MMEWFWSQFIPGFCKAQFLCHGVTPNWLGWGVLAWGGLMAAGVALGIFGALLGGDR
jgi:hypothetical protein